MPSLSGVPSASQFHFFLGGAVWGQSSKLLTEGTVLTRLRIKTGLSEGIAVPISSEQATLLAHRWCRRPSQGEIQCFIHSCYQHPSNCHYGYSVTARTFRKAHCFCHCSHGPCAQRQCVFIHVPDTVHLEAQHVSIYSCNMCTWYVCIYPQHYSCKNHGISAPFCCWPK